MSERELQQAVLDCARLFGWRAYHTFDSRRSARGFPDVVLVRPPRLLAAELKAEHGRLTLEQHRWLDALRACPGVEAVEWRPHDWTSGAIERALRRVA